MSAYTMPVHPDKISEAIATHQNLLSAAKIQEELVRGINAPSQLNGIGKTTVNGIFRALAVLIEFSDNAASVPAEDFDTLIFEDRMGTVRNYYKVVSYNNLDIVTLNLPSSIGWTTAPQTYAYYVNGERGMGTYPNNTQKLCEDIAALIDPVVDFSDYDNNSDGYVDAFILIHSGPGYEYTLDVNDIHSHKWGIWPPVTYDGVSIYEYNIQPEYWNAPGDITCGVYCHELGHTFGLPDLYDTDYSSRGVGLWSIMATGSWGGPGYDGSVPVEFDAWSRAELGFHTPTNVAVNMTNVSIASVESGGPIFRLWSGGAGGNEYFLVENRQKTGYDTYLPGDGLLIWHIDESRLGLTDNDNEWYPGYTSNGNYAVALEQADGLFQLEQLVNSGNSGDPFPGSGNVTSFTSLTTPNSNSYAGDDTYVFVSNISPSGPVMNADFQVSLVLSAEDNDNVLLPANCLLGNNYPNPFNPTTNIDLNLKSAGNVTLSVYDILGKKVETLISGFYPAGNFTLTWNGTDNNGIEVSSGVYFYEIITEDEKQTKKMTLIK
jgi:immune inhibitor A